MRHEGSHALAAWFEGTQIHEVGLLPGFDSDLGFYFGFVLPAYAICDRR